MVLAEAGAKYNTEKTINDWYDACQAYERLTSKVKVKEFLLSAESGPNFSGTDSEAVSFSRQLKKFRSGELQPSKS